MSRQERSLEPRTVTGITFVYEYVFNLEKEADDDLSLEEELEMLLEDYENVHIYFDSFEIIIKYESKEDIDEEQQILDTIKDYGAVIIDWKTNHKEDEWYYYEKVVE